MIAKGVKRVECPICGGHGYVTAKKHTRNGHIVHNIEDCPLCDCRGEVEVGPDNEPIWKE